jgi:hypothetical protein
VALGKPAAATMANPTQIALPNVVVLVAFTNTFLSETAHRSQVDRPETDPQRVF